MRNYNPKAKVKEMGGGKRGRRWAWVVLGLVVLALAQLWVSNRLVTAGVEVAEINRQAKMLAEENQRLNRELVAKESLGELVVEAEMAGFEPARRVVSVGGFLPVAEKREF